MVGLSESEARLVIASARCPGNVQVNRAIAKYGAAECVANPSLLPTRVGEEMQSSCLADLENDIDAKWVIPGDPGWPSEMQYCMEEVPLGLWVRGNAHTPVAISVVGARSATEYGEFYAGEISADLASSAISVISGGAYGIDAAAHRGALAAGGHTIAVMAGGVDNMYPRGNTELFERILETGAIVSEMPLRMKPERHSFLVRNRIIAAWGVATLVIEARERSGALATAGKALDFGRDVMALPGHVASASSVGCHQLIRKGAALVTSAVDIAEFIGRERGAMS